MKHSLYHTRIFFVWLLLLAGPIMAQTSTPVTDAYGFAGQSLAMLNQPMTSNWPELKGSDGMPILLKSPKAAADFDLIETIKGLFSESDIFTDKATFIWTDYQLFSNRGKRSDLTKTTIPMVGLHYERQLLKGLGVRGSLSTNWWEETRTLAATPTEKFNEVFSYQYWTLGLGPTYHLTVNKKWDPFVGFLVSYRLGRASCSCYTLSQSQVSGDFFVGTRYFPSKRFFLISEFGQQGTGYLKIGTGFKL